MNAKPVTVIAKVKAKPGKESDVMQLLLSLGEPSRRDAGCLNYDLHRSADDPSSFLFHENWTSRDHLDRHLAKPDLQATLAKAGAMVAVAPEITIWERLA